MPLLLLLRFVSSGRDALRDGSSHTPYRLRQAHEDRFPNENMANVQFADLRKSREVSCGFEVEAVARMDLKAGLRRKLRGSRKPPQLGLGRVLISGEPRFAILAGMQLHNWGGDTNGSIDLAWIGIDKKRNANAAIRQAPHDRAEGSVTAGGIEAALRCDFLPAFRNDAARVRGGLDGDGRHLLRGRHLKIEGGIDLGHDPADIFIANMTPILAEVRRNAIGASLDGHARRTNGIGKEAASGITQRCNVIDVQAKANGRRLHRADAAAASWLALSARLSCWA